MSRPLPGATLAVEVARAAHRPRARKTLFLDLDGTLAAIVPDPSAARVPAATQAAIGRLVEAGWRVVVVSGRRRAEARRMVPDRRVEVYGGHGLEGLPRRSAIRDALARIRRVATRAERLVPNHRGARVERKPAGLALHDREIPAGQVAKWRRALRALLSESDLAGIETLKGRRVIELRPSGIHKGLVVEHVLGPRPWRRTDASIVALGDDATDEDMFRALGRRGLSVRVGRSSAKTLAGRRLPSPQSAGRFLLLLARL